jgi:hypothetical protein
MVLFQNRLHTVQITLFGRFHDRLRRNRHREDMEKKKSTERISYHDVTFD